MIFLFYAQGKSFLVRLYTEEIEMIKINGKELELADKTLAEYLAAANYDPKRIAVERNGDIVPKSRYGETVLTDGDSVEIVSFVGGG